MRDLASFIQYLFSLIRYRLFFWLALIMAAALLEGLSVSLFIPLLSGTEVESGVAGYVKQVFEFFRVDYTIAMVLVFMVVFFVIRSGFLVFQEMYATRIITRIMVDMKKDLVDKLYRSDYRYFVRNEVGYFTNAVTIEYNNVAFAFEMCMRLLVATGFAIIYFALPLGVDPLVTGIIVLLFVPVYFVLRKVNEITKDYSFRATAINAQLQSYLLQTFNNFKYLKATYSGRGILRKVNLATEQQGEIRYKQAILSSFASKGAELLLILLVAGLLFYNTVILDADFIAMLFLLFLLRRAMMFALEAQAGYRKFVGVAGSIGVFKRLERELAENVEDFGANQSVPDFDQPIRFNNVSFCYDPESYVLNDVNLVIEPRKTVAIVGASGAGKSTFATLLTGLLKPQGGEILLGDKSFSDIDQRLLRQGIGYVTQESVIFNDTIHNNITLWSDGEDEGRVESVASRAYLKDFIESLPNHYQSNLGDSGLNVSGGQRQRINIARELYKDVKFLIFDEATSSLDTQAEREIQRNIDDFRGEKTVVIIAHRLSTVRNSDMIFVLGNGSVVEQGSYDYLYSLKGEFRAMVDRQALTGDSAETSVSNGK
jgi:subfamily B ATP-binding cassette protein MsbA